MKKIIPIAFLAAVIFSVCGCSTPPVNPSPQGTVVVNYDHPENFTDLKSASGGPTEPGYLESLRNFAVTEAGKYLRADQTLTLTFTDIDMAGEVGMNVRNSDVRVIRSSYPLRLLFTYSLTDASHQIVKEGKADLTEAFPSLQMGLDPGDPLFHEKTKLGDWMRKTLQ